jgi:HEAT repeat protein
MKNRLFIMFLVGLVIFSVNIEISAQTYSDYLNKRVDELIRQLGNSDWQLREKAGEELIDIGVPAKLALQKALSSPDAEVHERIVKIIPIILWKESFIKRLNVFIGQLRAGKFEDQVLFQDVIAFLSRDESVFILIDILKDKNQPLPIRQQIALALGNIQISFKPMTNDLLELTKQEKDDSIRSGLLRILARTGKDERIVALAMTLLKEGPVNLKTIAINTMVETGDNSVLPEIMKSLKDADANVKNTALYALNRFRTEQSTQELIRFMKEEPISWLRAQAVAILANYNDARLIPDFLWLLKNDKDLDVLRNTLYALQRFRGDKVIPLALIEFLKTAPAQLQPSILGSLQALNDRSVIPELIKILEKESDYSNFNIIVSNLQSLAGNQKFTPQTIPDVLKNDIVNRCKEWWEKNK